MLLNLLTLAGIIIAVVLFLNFLSAGTGISGNQKGSENDGQRPRLNAKRVLQQPPSQQRPRICPVCGTLLNQSEYLIAALEPEPGGGRKRKAQIYGCPHCYTTGGVNLEKNGLSNLEPDLSGTAERNKLANIG